MTSVQPLLEIRNLTIEFALADGSLPAVRDISLTILEGETVGLVGESGSGKSATALSILRLLPPSARIGGEIRFQGSDILTLGSAQLRHVRGGGIGIVFQDPMTSLNPVLTVGRQISETIQTHLGLGRRAARDRTRELLELVEIPDVLRRLDEYPHQFSGGMRQRAMIAMALSCAPKLLIADEPTTALDVTIQAQILDLLHRLHAELGMSLLLITHDLGVIAGTADSIRVMYAGRIVENGPIDAVFADPRHPYTEGLLKSSPRLGTEKHERLFVIEGSPPNLLGSSLVGCPFRPRCAYAVPKSAEEEPPLLPSGADRETACWVDLATARRE